MTRINEVEQKLKIRIKASELLTRQNVIPVQGNNAFRFT